MRLEIQLENGLKEVFETFEREIVVGRGSTADLRIKSDAISREHAKIQIKSGKFYVTDLNSSNGTQIGEDKLKPNEAFEWQTFFPINIGSGITITFLPEKDDPFAMNSAAGSLTATSFTKKKDDKAQTKSSEVKATFDNADKEKRKSIFTVIIPFVFIAIVLLVLLLKPELIGELLN